MREKIRANKFCRLLKAKFLTGKLSSSTFFIVMSFFLVFCIVLLGVTGYFLKKYAYEVNMNEYLESTCQNVEQGVGRYIDDLNKFNALVENDTTLYHIITEQESDDKRERIHKILENIIKDFDIIDNVEFYGMEHNLLFRYEDCSYTEVKEIISDDIKPTGFTLFETVVEDNAGNYYMVFGKRLHNFNYNNDIGYMYIYVRRSVFDSIVEALNYEDNEVFFVFNDTVFWSVDKNKIGKMVVFPSIVETENELGDYIYDKRKINISVRAENEMYMVNLISRRKLNADIEAWRKEIGVLLLVAFFISLVLTFIISRIFTRSIRELQDDIKKYVNGSAVSVDFKFKELSALEEDFNAMIIEINELIKKNNEEKEKQRVAEMKALQAQINPHFIYNTLDALGWHARFKKQDYIAKMIQALADFFRISLQKGESVITLRDEIKHIESYMKIEQMRFPELFTVDIDIEEEILDCKIVKLVLQPLVENSIKHGFERITENGVITIRGRAIKEDIVITVTDNGCGFEENPLECETKNKSYGIKNVNERLALAYGEGYGLSCRNISGGGAEVTVRIRKQLQHDN